jgi:hypothetical protein
MLPCVPIRNDDLHLLGKTVASHASGRKQKPVSFVTETVGGCKKLHGARGRAERLEMIPVMACSSRCCVHDTTALDWRGMAFLNAIGVATGPFNVRLLLWEGRVPWPQPANQPTDTTTQIKCHCHSLQTLTWHC